MKRLLLILAALVGLSSAADAVTYRRGTRHSAPRTASVDCAAPAASRLLSADFRPGEGKMLRKAAPVTSDFNVITTPPAGEKVMMLGNSMTFYIYYDEIAQDETFGIAYECVFTDSGEVYLKNPISMLEWDTYIKGRVTDEGLTFDFPQPLMRLEDSEGDGTVDLCVDVLEYTEVGDDDDYYVTFAPAQDTRSITFIKDEDGNYMMDGEYMMGVTWNDYWQGYGEMGLQLCPFEGTPVVAPEGLRYDYSYILVDELNGWDHTIEVPIGIGKDGDKWYLKGLASFAPDAVIEGTFDAATNMLTIPSGQFMGNIYSRYVFMFIGDGYTYYDDLWEEDMVSMDITDSPMLLSYDPDKDVFTPVIEEEDHYAYFIFNLGNLITYPCAYYAVDRIYSQGAITDFNPVSPMIEMVNDIGELSDYEYSYTLEFDVFPRNAEGQIFQESFMYYNIFINGELYPLTSEDFPFLADLGLETLTDIPYSLGDDDDIYVAGDYHGIAFKKKDIRTIGVRAVYYDGENRGESEIVTAEVEGGIAVIEGSGIISSEYYDFSGMRIARPMTGRPVIRRDVHADGTVSVTRSIGR